MNILSETKSGDLILNSKKIKLACYEWKRWTTLLFYCPVFSIREYDSKLSVLNLNQKCNSD